MSKKSWKEEHINFIKSIPEVIFMNISIAIIIYPSPELGLWNGVISFFLLYWAILLIVRRYSR